MTTTMARFLVLQRAFASPEGRAAASDVNTLSSTASVQVRSMIYELEDL